MIETPSRAVPGAESAAARPPLTLRQEEFCRHYAATGNAAGAARDAGYAAGSARQTGHELLERAAVAARVRVIRAAWQAVERAEAQILLGRLEQAWDAAVEKGSASLMLRVIKLQAELSGLDRRNAHRRAGLWPLPMDVPGEAPGAISGEAALACPADTEPGPLAEALRRGRHRTERALAAHRANRKALERRGDFDEAAWLATAQRLHATVEERRPRNPDPQAGRPAPAMTNPDISLHGSLHRSLQAAADGAGPEAPIPTEHDISLHRAGLLPAAEEDNRERTAAERAAEKFREYRIRADRAYLRYRSQDAGPVRPPAGEPGPVERRAAEEEQEYLKGLACTRPRVENQSAGWYLAKFKDVRPCRGDEPDHDES